MINALKYALLTQDRPLAFSSFILSPGNDAHPGRLCHFLASKQESLRYFHINEDEEIDEARLAEWIRQAAELPGEALF